MRFLGNIAVSAALGAMIIVAMAIFVYMVALIVANVPGEVLTGIGFLMLAIVLGVLARSAIS